MKSFRFSLPILLLSLFYPGSKFSYHEVSSHTGSLDTTVANATYSGFLIQPDTVPHFEKKSFSLGENTLPYQIMFPENYDPKSSYPLVVFLHGAGERGSGNMRQMTHGPATFASDLAREKYPAIVIFPQCPSDVMWSRRIKYRNDQDELIFEFPVEDKPNYAMELVIKLVRDLIPHEAVDENRIYVTGLSMGGIGAFEFSYYAPELPAAVASLAGGHDSGLVSSYAGDIEFRLYHGSDDTVVPARYSAQMFRRLTELGYNAQYFEEPGRGHEWNYVLEDPEYLEWMFSVSKED